MDDSSENKFKTDLLNELLDDIDYEEAMEDINKLMVSTTPTTSLTKKETKYEYLSRFETQL
jgi:hypothetical protein